MYRAKVNLMDAKYQELEQTDKIFRSALNQAPPYRINITEFEENRNVMAPGKYQIQANEQNNLNTLPNFETISGE